MLGDGTRAHELFEILNPINHARTPEDVERYRLEPYVVAADVYVAPAHRGRGGWTWYTGSAAWLYRLAVEWLLGLRLNGETFVVAPTIPADWPSFEMTYRRGGTRYEIRVENPDRVCRGVQRVELDGAELVDGSVPILDDGGVHTILVVLGTPERAPVGLVDPQASEASGLGTV
jgi:cyclic beta-1,2-glucan synthetase